MTEEQEVFLRHIQKKGLKRTAQRDLILEVFLKTEGHMGESAVDEKISPIYTRYENPQTTILFNSTEIEIHLRAHGRTEADADALLDDLSLKIETALGNSVFSFGGETRGSYHLD